MPEMQENLQDDPTGINCRRAGVALAPLALASVILGLIFY